jgi:hypothetical protein
MMDAVGLIETLPLGCLSPSSLVDALHLAAGTKQVLRTRLLDGANIGPVLGWYKTNGLEGMVDEDRFVVVGKHCEVVEQAIRIDRSPVPHEMTLGLLLGYPACCCGKVAEAGEAQIDRLADAASRWQFIGDYSLIDPSGYVDGEALICHVPCSSQCSPSLQLAYLTLALIHSEPRLATHGKVQRLLRRVSLPPSPRG